MSIGLTKNNFDIPVNVERAEELFAQYGDFIRSIIYFNSKNQDLSEDLFHDIFLHFVAKPIPYDVQNIEGFLYKVVSDKIKDSFRKIKHYHARIQRYAESNPDIIEEQPDQAVINVEESEKMFEIIEKNLSTNEAIAVILRYRNDYNTTMVAQKMGIKPRSVSRYISIGITKLRRLFCENRRGNYDNL